MWISRKEYKFLKENAEKNINLECQLLTAKENQSRAVVRAMEEYSTVLMERDQLKLRVIELEHQQTNENNGVQLDNKTFLMLCQLGMATTVVYMGIKRHLNKNTNKCYPSNRLLQKELNLSDKTITKAVKTLKEAGLLKVEIGKGGCYNYSFPEPIYRMEKEYDN
jgi:biotin operon repressor